MQQYTFTDADANQLFSKILEKLGELKNQVLLVFDFDGVLCASRENRIYKMPAEPDEDDELTKLADAWDMNLNGYDIQYKRHLLFQAAAAQVGLPIEPGVAFSLARNVSAKGQKVFVLTARSGVYAISRMHEFLSTSGIRPIEVFHLGRVTKEKQIALLLEKFPDQHVFYFEDESQHISDIKMAFTGNPNANRLHLIQIVDKPISISLDSLRERARSVLNEGLRRKLKEVT